MDITIFVNDVIIGTAIFAKELIYTTLVFF